MNTEPPPSWAPCESELLAGISSGKHATRRRRVVRRRVAVATAAVALLALGVWGGPEWAGVAPENNFGGIACREVRDHLPAMLVGELPEDVAGRVEEHLRQCPMCQRLLQKMQAATPARAIGSVPTWAEDGMLSSIADAR